MPMNRRQHLLEEDWLQEQGSPPTPVLRFSPTAWAKLLYFRDRSANEIGGFGITEPDDLLLVKEFVSVKQEVTEVSVRFDDEAVGQFFDAQVDLGRRPEQFGRIWCHTHPAMSPEPSATDEETFQRVFGNCQWAVMFVLARTGKSYARLGFHVGPGGQVLIPTEVDYSQAFGPSDHQAWEAEYQANVQAMDWCTGFPRANEPVTGSILGDPVVPSGLATKLDDLEPAERQLILDELAERPDLWADSVEEIFP